MRYTKINGIEAEVSRVAFGCMSTVPSQTYGGVDDADAIATMRHAFDKGINFFDTARAYNDGHSERQLGEAFKGSREKMVIASKPKAKDLSEREIITECEQSLKDLQVERIDLYQLHWPKRVVPLEESVRAMEKLLADGKIGAIGVCNFGDEDLKEWLSLGSCATDQIAYSLVARGYEVGLQDRCVENGVGVLCYSPLGQGLLAGRYKTADEVPSGKARTVHFRGDRPEARHGGPGFEDETFEAIRAVCSIAESLNHSPAELALAWCLHQPGVAAVLAGASRPGHVDSNAKAGDILLSAETLERLDEATAGVKAKIGGSIDMWELPPRTR